MIRDLDALLTFVEVVDRAGFSAAARRLGISKSVASRRVQRLEAALHVQLLQRTTRGLVPTEAGQAFHARCAGLLQELATACDEAGDQANASSGLVRITASPAFARALVAPVLASLVHSNPGLEFEVIFDDRRFDATGEGTDIALRAGAIDTPNVVARQIALVGGAAVASPAYLASHVPPRTPAELASHVLLDHGELAPHGLWRFHGEAPLRAGRRVRMNSFDALCELALRGAGIAALPAFLVREPIARGELVAVLPGYTLVEHPLSVVYAQRRLPPKVRAVLEAFIEYARQPVADWGAAEQAPRASPAPLRGAQGRGGAHAA